MSLDAMTASGALSLDVGSALPSAPRPPTRREREAARARTQRREAAAKGLCISCPPRRRRSARPGKKTCVDCAKRSRTYDRTSLKAAQKAGRCGRCRKVPREVGALCKGCDERVKSYPSHGTNVTRERRADENLCANGCGGSAFDRKLCLDCAGDENAKDRARREERIAQGLCYRCGKRPAPPRAGLFVWEGHAESEPDEIVGGWDFVGAWRAPTTEEMARLVAGLFPLRGHAFPATGDEEDFEAKEARRG